jgi:HK97 family phage portal protein
MNIKERLAKFLFPGVIKDEIEKSSRQVVSHVLGLSASEGILPEVDLEIYNQMYEQTSWVRAVVGVICKAVTARGYTLVPSKPNADQRNAETLSEFFSNCNPNDTFLEILDDITRDAYVFGNAFLEVVHGADGKPKELWNLDATTVRVKADEHGSIQGYVQMPKYSLAAQSGRVDFDPNEVIHFKLGTKGATLYGLSPLASLILPITVDKFAQIYNRAFFINGGKIKGAFIMKNSTAEQVERNREFLNARARNPDLAHADLVLEGDTEYRQIGVNQKDMEFLELREFTRNEILAVYGVPPSKVSIIETGNIGSGTGEHQTQTFYEETILPFQMRLAEKITKHIIRQGFGIQDWSFQFNKRSIDEKDQAEIFNIYLQGGVFTPEEVRRLVAPRMPELGKTHKGENEIVKGKLGASQSITETPRSVLDLENRFIRALGDQFRRIKDAVSRRIPSIVRERVAPKIEKEGVSFDPVTIRFHDIALRQYKFPDAVKRVDDLEVILELIDQDGIARVLEKHTLEAAAQALKLAARRNKLRDIDDISGELEEFLRSNASTLASHVAESIKASLRQTLIEGIGANESIQQLQSRVENQLDSFATVNIRPVIDAKGNVVRSGHARSVSRSTAAELIARTEANRAYNEGNLDALHQAGIEKVVFLLSSDACPECRAVSESIPGEKLGKTLGMDEARSLLPIHPNCRCTFISEV